MLHVDSTDNRLYNKINLVELVHETDLYLKLEINTMKLNVNINYSV